MHSGCNLTDCASAAGAARNRAAAPSSDQHWGAAATCQTRLWAPVRLQALVMPQRAAVPSNTTSPILQSRDEQFKNPYAVLDQHPIALFLRIL